MKKMLPFLSISFCLYLTGICQNNRSTLNHSLTPEASGVTYYSTGSADPAVLTNWNTSRDGSGSAPANFTSGNTFVIESGDNMITTTTWGISGTGSKLQIENGGTLTANHSVTLTPATTFQIDNGGSYIQNVSSPMASTILAGTEVFGTSSNFIYNFAPSGTSAPSAPGYGNLTLNTTTNTGNFGWGGSITKIQGNFTILCTGTGTIRHALTANAAIMVTVGGNFSLSGTNTNFWLSSGTGTCSISVAGDLAISGNAILDLANSSGAGTLNIGGNYNQTGGTLKSNTAVSAINFTGNGKTFSQSSGTMTNTNINWIVASGAALLLNNDISVAGSRSLAVNGTLNCSNSLISGPGSFTLNAGATLGIGSAEGITASGLSGNIQVSGTRTFNTGANYSYNGTGAQLTGDGLPATINHLTVNGGSLLTLTAAQAVSGSLIIGSGAKLTIPSSGSLAVAGNSDLAGAECLLIQSDAGGTGSFLCEGSITGTGTARAECYIEKYNTADDGWHLISCPVSSFTVSGSAFEPVSGNDDLYRFDETQYLWINWQVNPFDFGNEEGYLCAYKTDGLKSFTGILNNEDHTLTGLSFHPMTGGGWHVIPNPFPCGFTWNSSAMSDEGYTSTASGKIINAGSSYTDVTDGQIIPAMNGFVMQVNNAINSITIPKSLRIPGPTTWLKNSGSRQLMLTARSDENSTYQETLIRFDENATEGFDPRFDSPFFAVGPTVPMLYTTLADQTDLSLNTFPALVNTRIVPLNFIKGSSSAYSIHVSRLDELGDDVSLSIEDLLTGKRQDLRQNPSFTFTSTEGDNPHRFLLHIGEPNAMNDIDNDRLLYIYAKGNKLYVSDRNGKATAGNIYVYNLIGQKIIHQKLNENTPTIIAINAISGYYLVKVIADRKVWTDKIFLH